MNKIFTLLIALPLFLNAQNKGDFELSIGGGPSLAVGYGGDADGLRVRNASMWGVTGEYYFNERWGFKSGLIYDSKGAEADEKLLFIGSPPSGSFKDEVKLDYLFIPLYANWHFGPNRNCYLNFGPYVAFLLDAEMVSPLNFDVKDNVNSFDTGLGVGIGHKFDISDRAAIFIEYQGTLGFVKVPEDIPGFNDVFNTRSALNAGLVFTL